MTEYNDRTVKQMVYPAVAFLFIGVLIGVIISYNAFIFPDYFAGEYVSFGRLRPVHVNTVALMWLLGADMGLLYYLVPRLCGINLWSQKLATCTSALFWFTTFTGIYSLPFGGNFGWEYAELPKFVGFLPIKLMFAVCWVMFTTNILMTILNRKHEKMYVSLWYTMGSLVWTTVVYVVGNILIEFVPGGISRVNTNFFYVHNLVGLIFTPLGVAIAYYFIPKTAKTPLYSHKLSMIGFWTISFVYAWTGAHHMIHGPESQWLQTTAIIFSMWLIIPVWTVVTNFFGTMKGQWSQYTHNPSIRFLMMGTVFYTIVCIQGPMQALRNVNEITSKTDWVIGHAHMALLGAFSFFSMAGVYFVVPKIKNRPLFSNKLANWHFSLTLLGSMLMFVSLFIGGFLQGMQWATWASGSSYAQFHENLTKLSFLQTIADMKIWWSLRSLSGVFILIGSLFFALNIFSTILKPKEELQHPTKEGA